MNKAIKAVKPRKSNNSFPETCEQGTWKNGPKTVSPIREEMICNLALIWWIFFSLAVWSSINWIAGNLPLPTLYSMMPNLTENHPVFSQRMHLTLWPLRIRWWAVHFAKMLMSNATIESLSINPYWKVCPTRVGANGMTPTWESAKLRSFSFAHTRYNSSSILALSYFCTRNTVFVQVR